MEHPRSKAGDLMPPPGLLRSDFGEPPSYWISDMGVAARWLAGLMPEFADDFGWQLVGAVFQLQAGAPRGEEVSVTLERFTSVLN